MNRNVHHKVIFNSPHHIHTRTNQTSKTNLDRLRLPNKSQFNSTNALYLLENAVGKIYQILRYIELSAPYIDKYGPIIKEMPTMYKLMKAINEIDDESNDDHTESTVINNENSQIIKQSTPKLYI